jgi:hypothetical protein
VLLPAAYIEGTITYTSLAGIKGTTKFCFFPVYPNQDLQKVEKYPNCDTPGSNTMR